MKARSPVGFRFFVFLAATSILFFLIPALPLGWFYIQHSALALAADEDDAEAKTQKDREEFEAKLDKIRTDMKREQKALSKVLGQEGNVVEKVEALQKQLIINGQRRQRLADESTIIAIEQQELDKEIAAIERRSSGLIREMTPRIRARYRFGRSGYSRVVFNANDVPDLARRLFYLSVIARADVERLREHRDLVVEWRSAQARLENKKSELAELDSTLAEQADAIEKDKKQLEETLRAIREEKKKHEAAIAELKRNSARLSGMFGSLEKKREEQLEAAPDPSTLTGAFASLKGRMCYPASGAVTVPFGKRINPEFNTETMHNGVEIGAAKGARVHAVADGTVRFASWFRGYGNLIIIDHGDGYYTVYAHLESIGASVGDEVKAGQSIGTVGDTGSMNGPSLYFEVRHRQTPQNPQAWLAGCAY